MNIRSSGKSVQSGDNVVRNQDGQGRFAFLGCETETVSLNPRLGAHQSIANPQACPPHQLDDRSHFGAELIGGTTGTLVILIGRGNHLFIAATQ